MRAAAAAMLLLLLAPGCGQRQQREQREHPRSSVHPLSERLLALSEQAREQLGLRDLPASGTTAAALRRLVDRARGALGPRVSGPEAVDRLNRLLFDELGLRREVDDRSIEHMLLPRVLADRRGSCLGLAGLYLALAEQLGLPLRGVLVPGHFFVRYDGPDGQRGVELLRRGQQLPASWYHRQYRIPPGNPLYLRSLSTEETLAVFGFNLANELRLRGKHRAAVARYQQVLSRLPRFAEARASLGLAHQLLGDRARAEAAYRQAARDNPYLVGLDRNLAALRRDEAASR